MERARPSRSADGRGVLPFARALGPRLRAARVANGLSVAALARAVGVSSPMISNIEGGKTMPSVDTLRKLCDCLEISPDDLFAPAVPE
jgi:transcriptional regulator with XRE-family HTH domain